MKLGFASVLRETEAWKVRGRGETLFNTVLGDPPTLVVTSSRCEARKRRDCIRPVVLAQVRLGGEVGREI